MRFKLFFKSIFESPARLFGLNNGCVVVYKVISRLLLKLVCLVDCIANVSEDCILYRTLVAPLPGTIQHFVQTPSLVISRVIEAGFDGGGWFRVVDVDLRWRRMVWVSGGVCFRVVDDDMRGRRMVWGSGGGCKMEEEGLG